ncbi:hypothetical protein BOX15_Mlig032014g2 [Macrostomum lignano]|uniref:dual-specificity kinase n=1 Tax=Macrostomum lignano TaxID=282301 RepID=A0A267FPS0_9PLAT|nr:hypothetical protein BOX15_Mlig032014g2 [Macrostomum lignano]
MLRHFADRNLRHPQLSHQLVSARQPLRRQKTTATTTSTTGPLGRQHQSLRGPDRTAAALLAPIQFQSTRAAGGGQSYRGSRRYPARTNADSNGQYLGAVFPSIVNGDLGASNRPQVGAGGSITTRHHQHHPAAAAAGHDGVPALPSIRTRRGHRAAFAAPAPQPTAVAQASMADDAAIVASMLDSENDEKKSSGGPTVMSPNEAVRLYRQKLSAYELEEIHEFSEVWFVGPEAKKVEAVQGSNNNHGFDDDSGAYLKVTNDHVAYRYETLETLGRGSFGQVVRARDHKTGNIVALKIIRNRKRFHHQAAVEVKILDALRRKDPANDNNVVHMIDFFTFRNHLCIVFELLGINLYDLTKRNNFQGFNLQLIRKFAISILKCLKLLRREGIIHCDLKPENILLRSKGHSAIKVVDFGSSCYENQKVYTYIQSRFYRSPEVILGIPYGLPIDMFSLGCVVAELHTGYPLFPGENEVEQLNCIMEVNGVPPKHILDQATRRRVFFDSKGNPRSLTNSKGKRRVPGSRQLEAALKSDDKNFLDFVARCIEWDAERRMTPEEAMQHPWISERAVEARFRQPGDVTTRFSPTAGVPVVPPPAPSTKFAPGSDDVPDAAAIVRPPKSASNHASRHRQKQKQQQQQQDKRERKSSETTTTAATTATGAAATAEPVNPTAASNAPVDEANVELDKNTAEDAAGDDV